MIGEEKSNLHLPKHQPGQKIFEKIAWTLIIDLDSAQQYLSQFYMLKKLDQIYLSFKV